MKHVLLILFLLLPSLVSAQMTAVTSGSGINQIVTVTSANQFKLIFEAQDNWGLSQWYDLVNDPNQTTNLALAYSVNGPANPCFRENGIPQVTYYGDNDKKQNMFEAGCSFSGSTRSMSVLASNPLEVVIQTSGSPMDAIPNIDTNITGTTTYVIHWNGQININQSMSVVNAQNLNADNFVLEVGLNDPAGGSSNMTTSGWIRASDTANPFNSSSPWAKYVFAYWNSFDPNYPNFTKASILLVPGATAKALWATGGGQILHGWNCGTGCGTQRWGFRSGSSNNFNFGNGGSLTWDWMIQLGTQNSSVLPNLTSSTIADPIANAYLATATVLPPFISPFDPTASPGGSTVTFSCTQNCGTGATPWSCANTSNGGTCLGSINTSTGVYTPPASLVASQSWGGYPIFPPDHIFNTNIASLPTRSDSNTLINGAGSVSVNYLPSFGVNYTNGSTPTDNLNFFYTPANNAAFQSPPWPTVIEGGWFDALLNDANADHHFITLDTTNGNIGERYQFYAQAPVTSCTVGNLSGTSGTCTFTPTTTSSGFGRAATLGNQVSMGSWTAGDSYLNGMFTLTGATPTTFTFLITHGAASTSTSGQATLNVQIPGSACQTAGTCNSQSGVQYTNKDYTLPANASTDAAGMFLLPLTLHSQEVELACTNGTLITHALRATLQNGFLHPALLWPATTFATAGAGANYYGERVRLKSSFAIGAFSACAQILLTQMKNYGLIFADGGGGWQIETDIDNTTPAATAAMLSINAANIAPSNFEVVDESSLMEQPFEGSASNGEIVTYTSTTGTVSTHVDLQGTALNASTQQYYIMAGTPAQMLSFFSNGAFTCAMSPTVGSITSGCLYTPPASEASVTKTTVTATSSVNGAVVAQMIVYVTPATIRLIQCATSFGGCDSSGNFTDSHSNVWYSGGAYGIGMSNVPSWQGCCQNDGSLTGTDKQLFWNHLYSSSTQMDYKMDFHVPAGTYLVTFNNGTEIPISQDIRYFYAQGNLISTVDSTAVSGGLHLPWTLTAFVTVGSNNLLSFYNAGQGGQAQNSGDISSVSIQLVSSASGTAPRQTHAILLP